MIHVQHIILASLLVSHFCLSSVQAQPSNQAPDTDFTQQAGTHATRQFEHVDPRAGGDDG